VNQGEISTVIGNRVRTFAANGREKGSTEMAGIQVFKTLADALRAGYSVYDRTEDGYLVRTRTASGWAMAIVTCR
jgi:hypothetical protein